MIPVVNCSALVSGEQAVFHAYADEYHQVIRVADSMIMD